MRKTCLLLLALLGCCTIMAQQKNAVKTKDVYPKIGKKFDFSPAAVQAFKKENTDGMYEDIYDILGGGCSFYCACDIGKQKASSTLPAQGKYNYKASNAHDLNYETAWVEGAKDYGIGEWIEYTFPGNNPPLEEIIIANGYIRTEKTWKENSRVKTLAVEVNGKPFATLHLKDVYAEQTFDMKKLGSIKSTNPKKESAMFKVKFIIKDVYPGTKYKDTAISEIYFDGPAH